MKAGLGVICGLIALLTTVGVLAADELPACDAAETCAQSAPASKEAVEPPVPAAHRQVAALPAPLIVSPLPDSQVQTPEVILRVRGAGGTPHISLFELDTVPGFDSAGRRVSGELNVSDDGSASWTLSGLVENQRYFWRAKFRQEHLESAWVEGSFLMNAVNDAPPVPTQISPANAAWLEGQPVLQLAGVIDPEGDAVSYEFEVYHDAALRRRVAAGRSENPGWQPEPPLEDRAGYWWRARAVDALGAASGWSPLTAMYLSSEPYRQPEIAVLEPAQPVTPVRIAAAGNRKLVAIRWEGNDPNIEASLALYYDRNPGRGSGTLIVDGLRQPAGTHAGSYLWDVTDLPPGSYSISAVIYDARGSATARAPGSVVLVPAKQSGKLNVNAAGELHTSEDGASATFSVSLASKPTADVIVQVSSSMTREDDVSPQALVFSPANWDQPQTVTVTGKPDCVKDGTSRLDIQVGPSVSQDPQYMGIKGASVKVRNSGSASSIRYASNNPQIAFCSLRMISEHKTGLASWEYEIDAVMGNRGEALAGLSATLTGVPFFGKMLGGALEFGPVGREEAIRSRNTIRIQTSLPLNETLLTTGIGFEWSVAPR